MKTTAMWTAVVAIAALASGAAAKSAKSEEGYCKDDTTCAKLAAGYACVSVQTTRENTEEVKQCLPSKVPGDVCAGVNPGLCPSFSTWSKEFKSISSVCAYIVPTSKCAPDGVGDSIKGTVTCLNATSAISETTYGVIYGCVDYDGKKLLHEANSKSAKMATAFNYTSIISDGCVNPKNEAGSDVVCSGRGTCAPNAAGQMDYKCLCNVGYSGTFCQKIDSNKCTMTAQCAAGKCDLIAQECKCEPGTTGNQCAECDPTSTSACNKHGVCGAGASPGKVSAAGRRWLLAEAGSGSGNGNSNDVGSTTNAASSNNNNNNSSSSNSANMCKCETGYSGAHCDRKDSSGLQSTANKATSSPSDNAETDASKTPDSAGSLSAMTALTVVATLVVALLN